MVGTSMVIGDGVLTPCISVLSAVSGIKEISPSISEDTIAWISIVVLLFLFWIQRFGTEKVGFLFAPIILVWLCLIGGIGVYNYIKYDPTVIKAWNPKYIIGYFQRNKRQAWTSLGGVALCITGTEALFADLGHFSVRSIQISMIAIVYPSLLLAYGGQTSYLMKNKLDVSEVFYKSIPGPLYWPTLVISILSAVMASQATITGTFSIIQQSISRGFFPKLKVIHTSRNRLGCIYIPFVNYILMACCIPIILYFKTTAQIGNAYGLAVVFVMVLTSFYLVIIMQLIWKRNIVVIVLYVTTIGGVELIYLSSVLLKFPEGGYMTLVFAVIVVTIMFVWTTVQRWMYEKIHKNDVNLNQIAKDIQRAPGLAVFHLYDCGVPPLLVLERYVQIVTSLQEIILFVTYECVQTSVVSIDRKFHFRQIQPDNVFIFSCIIQYGYDEFTDINDEKTSNILVIKLRELLVSQCSELHKEEPNDDIVQIVSVDESTTESYEEYNIGENSEIIEVPADESSDHSQGYTKHLDNIIGSKVTHLVVESDVVAPKGARIWKRLIIKLYSLINNLITHRDSHNTNTKLVMVFEL
ncbi:hypothetical protein ABFS83_08G202800 [Erythranthe nasuta]